MNYHLVQSLFAQMSQLLPEIVLSRNASSALCLGQLVDLSPQTSVCGSFYIFLMSSVVFRSQ